MDLNKTKKILLMGNPNVGKSVVFSRLTGANVIASNYPGSTIEFTKGLMRIDGNKIELIDVPGTYSLEPTNAAEEVAVEMLGEGDLIINVIDSTNLERNLYLTLELLQHNTPVVIALNMWDEAKHNGITINPGELEKLLGVPVVPIVALTGEGVKTLLSRLKDAPIPTTASQSEAEKWIHIGEIIKKVQKIEHRHHTIWEKISDATVKPTTGLPIGLGIILLTFAFIRFIGEGLIGHVIEPLFDLYTPIAMEISRALGPGILHDIIIGRLIEGDIDYVQSMGLLTTGIFVPLGMV
ncbi:MAG: GTP-binding protein, partial [Methanosarcinales archaeon]|nr:GTP-binding protein [Methanosarcinales archaeon]